MTGISSRAEPLGGSSQQGRRSSSPLAAHSSRQHSTVMSSVFPPLYTMSKASRAAWLQGGGGRWGRGAGAEASCHAKGLERQAAGQGVWEEPEAAVRGWGRQQGSSLVRSARGQRTGCMGMGQGMAC